MAVEWVTLAELKNDQSLDQPLLTTRDDESLQRVLWAAMDFVRQYRPDLNYSNPTTVPATVKLGTLRLAAHWSMRKSIDLGEQGQRRNSELDANIYMQLGIRR